ncbi:NAD-dependent succinate-semialdehyde dehydrogenase, partial [Sphingomonas sp. HMWF008]
MADQAGTEYPRLGMYIDGEWMLRSDRTHRVVNPATGETLGELPLADAHDLDRALAAAERGFRHWRRTSVDERS